MTKVKPLIFCGRASFSLTRKVCEVLGVEQGDMEMMTHADSELWCRVTGPTQVTGRDVFIIQSTGEYAPKTYFDLWSIMAAVKRFGPRRLVVIMPFMGFRRQERDKEGGEAVMAELMARFVLTAGATDVVLCDPHAPVLEKFLSGLHIQQSADGSIGITGGEPGILPGVTQANVIKSIVGRVNLRVIHANSMFRGIFSRSNLSSGYKVLTPDAGRKSTASEFAEMLGIPMVDAHKIRPAHDQAESLSIEGDVRDCTLIIREDEISTGGTLINTIKRSTAAGAVDHIVVATHGVLVGDSVRQFKKMAGISSIHITDSIYLPWEKRIDKIRVITLAPTIAGVIDEIMSQN